MELVNEIQCATRRQILIAPSSEGWPEECRGFACGLPREGMAESR